MKKEFKAKHSGEKVDYFGFRRASVQFVEREQIPITPLPTESVTEMGDAFEEQQIASTNHNRRNSSDYNNMEDSGVSFMEFQNEFCRHYPNYPEI